MCHWALPPGIWIQKKGNWRTTLGKKGAKWHQMVVQRPNYQVPILVWASSEAMVQEGLDYLDVIPLPASKWDVTGNRDGHVLEHNQRGWYFIDHIFCSEHCTLILLVSHVSQYRTHSSVITLRTGGAGDKFETSFQEAKDRIWASRHLVCHLWA